MFDRSDLNCREILTTLSEQIVDGSLRDYWFMQFTPAARAIACLSKAFLIIKLDYNSNDYLRLVNPHPDKSVNAC